MLVLFVALGAFLGGAVRFCVQHYFRPGLALWTVNVFASLIFLYALRLQLTGVLGDFGFIVITAGFCGALSTWSSCAKYFYELWQEEGFFKPLTLYTGMVLPVVLGSILLLPS